MSNVVITISGPAGSGKSAIYAEIVIALTALGIPVHHENEKAWHTEVNMGAFTCAQDMFEIYKPEVTLREVISKDDSAPIVRHCPICGSSLVATERRPDGNSTCDQGHVFPTASCKG
jgi:hypothetical protein